MTPEQSSKSITPKDHTSMEGSDFKTFSLILLLLLLADAFIAS